MFEKLKSLVANDALYLTLVIILVGICAFALGRESTKPASSSSAPASVILYKPSDVTLPTPVSRSVIASKNGSKYHLPSCPGATQIKPENIIEFASPSEAEAAGYSPAATCPELTNRTP